MSEDKKGTKLTPSEDVRRKSVLAQQEVQASDAIVGGKTVDALRSAYVFVGHRDSAQNLEGFVKSCNEKPAESYKKALARWKQFSELEMTVIVLNRQALLQHYGPTFKLLGGPKVASCWTTALEIAAETEMCCFVFPTQCIAIDVFLSFPFS